MSVDSYVHRGVPIEIFIRLKPEPYNKQDLSVYENKITLLDQYDTPKDEFITNGAIFQQPGAYATGFENHFAKYVSALVQGVNYTLFTFGAKNSGRTFSLEGNLSETGLYQLFVDKIFYELESKKNGLAEEMVNNARQNQSQVFDASFTYKVRMKFVEIKDEGINDLLQNYNYYKQPIQLMYTPEEGYAVTGSAWVEIANIDTFVDVLVSAFKYRTTYDNGRVNKSTTILTFEINQLLEAKSTNEVKFVTSRATFYDMPSADILSEHFRSASNTNEFKSMYAFHNMITELSKSHNNILPTVFENSVVTKLMKESIGGNGLCSAVFTLAHSNFFISNIVFKIMKLCSNIQSYPIINNSQSFSLFKKYRVEISYFNKFNHANPGINQPPMIPQRNIGNPQEIQNQPINQQLSGGGGGGGGGGQQPFINPIPSNQGGGSSFPDSGNVKDMAGRMYETQEEKLRLQDKLRQREDEVVNLMREKTKLQLQYEQVRDLVDGDRFDVSDKLQHIENDINENNEIMMTVDKLHAQLREEKEHNNKLQDDMQKLREANAHLNDEMNKLSHEFQNYKTNSENRLHDLTELLNQTKNELNFKISEADKYRKIQSDLLAEIEEMNANFKRQLEDKEREIELKMLEIAQNEKRKLEAELREATRKIEDLSQEVEDLTKINEMIKKENERLLRQNEEMRYSMRDFFLKAIDESGNRGDSKQQLLKTFNEKENELIEELRIQKSLAENLKEKLRKMKMYGRKVRNIALDYFPVNEQLPEIMTKEINVYIEEAENESLIQFLEFEKETLRKRNSILEIENNRLKEQLGANPYEEYKKEQMHRKVVPSFGGKKGRFSDLSKEKGLQGSIPDYEYGDPNQGKGITESDLQRKIYEELMKLKQGPIENNEELNKLKNEVKSLKDENNKLRVLINETSLRDPDNFSTDNPKALQQQISFQKTQIQQLESERAELLVRATSAEEQLKNILAYVGETNQNYNKKILELSKRLEAADMRSNRYDKRLDQDFYDKYNNFD